MTPGDRVVVIGPSGGGKSTRLRVVTGLEQIVPPRAFWTMIPSRSWPVTS